MALSGVTSGWDVSLCKYQPAQIVTSANINTNRKMCNKCNPKQAGIAELEAIEQVTPGPAQENLHALTKLLPKKRGMLLTLHVLLYITFTY